MKKQILLLICIGLMQSLIAGPPGENTGLIQNTDLEQQLTRQQTITKRWKWAFLLLAGSLIGAGLTAGSYGIAQAIDSGKEAPEGLPQCNPVPWNRTEAVCESTLPSDDWDPLCAQLNAMRAYSFKPCVPACHWNIQNRRGVFPTAVGKERKLPEEVYVQFHENAADEYEYVVCENNPDSWLHRVKSFFSNHSIPYWTTKTESGVEGFNGILNEYPTEGLVYPEEWNSYVFDEELYNSEILQHSHEFQYSVPCTTKSSGHLPCKR